MVITDVFGKQPLEVLLVQHDHVVDEVSSATFHPSLGSSVSATSSLAFALWSIATHVYIKRVKYQGVDEIVAAATP